MKKYKQIGEYKLFENCRFCGSQNVKNVINLGAMPLAGGFLKNTNEIDSEKVYPLELNFCRDCFLLQVNSSVNPSTLFKNYFYFSSSMKTLVDHFDTIAKELHNSIKNPNKSFVVEIGCNDGAFLTALQKNGFKALGIDPATNVVKPMIKKGLPILNNYFTDKVAKKIVKKQGQADAVFGFHSMAHIEDMHDVARGIKRLLKKDGFLAMEVHYVGNLLAELQYDMIYHEHQFYYSLLSLQKFFKQYDMEIFDVKRYEKVRAGAIMFFVQNIGATRKITDRAKKLLAQEKQDGLHTSKIYEQFAKKIEHEKKQLKKLLSNFKKNQKTIVGYGASGRGTIMANYCNLSEYLDYIVDDATAKHGALLPGTHQRIYPGSKMVKDRVDYALLFAWPFLGEVLKKNTEYIKNGGKFIVPLPTVQIV